MAWIDVALAVAKKCYGSSRETLPVARSRGCCEGGFGECGRLHVCTADVADSPRHVPFHAWPAGNCGVTSAPERQPIGYGLRGKSKRALRPTRERASRLKSGYGFQYSKSTAIPRSTGVDAEANAWEPHIAKSVDVNELRWVTKAVLHRPRSHDGNKGTSEKRFDGQSSVR